MKRLVRKIPLILLALLFAANPLLAELVSAGACGGHSGCCNQTGMTLHGIFPGEMLKAGHRCCCNGIGVSSCAMRPGPPPDSGWAIPNHFNQEAAGAGPLALVAIQNGPGSGREVSPPPPDFHLTRALSPPIYLTHLTLIC